MFRILALEPEGEAMGGYLEEDDHYVKFILEPRKKIERIFAYSKDDYTGYEHFAGVMGKFDPHYFFFKKPVELERLKLNELHELYRHFYMAE